MSEEAMSPTQASRQLDCEPPEAKPRPRVLVVEDEALLRETLKDMLDALGYDVVTECGKVEEAIQAAGEANIDLALLDVNLGGERSFPVAEMLQQRGHPYLWMTGYGASIIPPSLAAPLLAKPFRQHDLFRVMVELENTRFPRDSALVSTSRSSAGADLQSA